MGLCYLKTWCLQALFPLRYIHANSGERSVPEVCAERMQVSPVKGTVGFASAQSGWSFTLQSFSKLYCEVYGIQLDHLEFARRLWGDLYFHPGDADPPCNLHDSRLLRPLTCTPSAPTNLAKCLHWSRGHRM